jgi:hypothetical protein
VTIKKELSRLPRYCQALLRSQCESNSVCPRFKFILVEHRIKMLSSSRDGRLHDALTAWFEAKGSLTPIHPSPQPRSRPWKPCRFPFSSFTVRYCPSLPTTPLFLLVTPYQAQLTPNASVLAPHIHQNFVRRFHTATQLTVPETPGFESTPIRILDYLSASHSLSLS